MLSFKNTKKVFALILAMAIVAMSMFTGVVVSAADTSVSEYTMDEKELSLLDPSQPNSQSNPYIIANANQMYCLMIGNSTNGGEAIDTAGKFFKVADGIDAFYMNGGATVAAFTTPAQVKEYFTVTNTSAKKVWSASSKAFKGTFDGNGVTIYGIRSDDTNAGLFPFVDGDATIKNVTVKNSYLVGATAAGLVGSVNGSAAPNSITAENCQIINNYISGSRGDCGAGGLFGFLYSAKATDGYPEVHVNNCIVAGNELIAVNASAPGAFSFVGSFGGNRQHKISNSIFLGGDHMFNVGPWWAKQPGFYENVYTDADLSLTGQTYTDSQIVQVTTTTGEDVKTAMPKLDWYKTWAANAGLPVLRAFHNIVTVDNGNGTHGESCSECGLVCANLDHVYTEGKCTCGAIEPGFDPYASEYTHDEPEVSLLDPTQPNSESNPYIIENANQMYCLMIGNSTNGGEKIDTTGKFFKVADGMKSFYMNGGTTLAAMTTTEQVKEYFTVTNTNARKAWSGVTFKGTFDGNGVTVYGIRSDDGNAGLFSKVSGNVTVKNVTVKNSYLAGQIAGGIVGSGISERLESVNIENCAVVNNYISASRGDSGAGALVGFLYNIELGKVAALRLNNCFVAGNEIVSTAGQTCTAIGGSYNSEHNSFNNSIFLGITPISAGWHTKTPEVYNNCYTDQDISASGMAYTDNQLVNVTTTTGEGVIEAMPNLDWYTTWAANSNLPVLRVFHNIVTVDNVDGTHSESCDICGLVCATLDHVYTEGKCTCGAIEPGFDPYASEYTHDEPEVSLLDPTKPNSESNPYIIENANQMYSLMIGNSTNGGEAIDTAGKFFKVADGMKAFYMNGGAAVAAFTAPEQVKEYFTVTNTSAKKVWSGSSKAFKGTFDGNGVTIYGIRSDDTNAGLFPFVDGDATIKNVTVKNSYLVGVTGAGLVGTVNGSAAPNSITAENCQVINNYISGSRGDCGAGGLFGFLYSGNATDGYPEIHVNNCIVAGNELIAVNASAPGAFSFAGSFGGNRQHKIKNSIFLGGDHIFNVGSWWAKQPGFYENVYTDADLSTAGQTYTDSQLVQVTTTTGEGVKAVMPNLDWIKTWAANAGLPALRAFHNIVDGTCERCGLVVFEDPCAKGHTLTSFDEVPATKKETGIRAHDKCEVCDRLFINGVEVTAEAIVIPMIVSSVRWQINTYDDDFIVHADQPGDGSKDNPYIIFDAEDLASVVVGRVVNVFGADKDTATPIDTTGVYFKVADGIDGFYMANDDPTYGSPDKWDTMEKVKAALSDKAGVYKWWKMNPFKGHFDGNGATVYGLYADKEDAGLFPMLGAGSEIKNIAVKNSYFKAANNAGAIAGQVQWYATIGDSLHTFDGCIAQNNYIEGTEAGAIIGHGRENKLIITNCLAAGNEFAGEKYLISTSWCESNTISNTVVIDGFVYGKGWNAKKGEIFSGVYANDDQSASSVEYKAEQVTVLDKADMTPENMPALDWAKVWINASTPELRVFHDLVATDNGDGTHTEICDCGLEVKSAHIVADGACVICGAGCAHTKLNAPVEENKVAATCKTTGKCDKVVYCADCGAEVSRETVELPIDANAHTYDDATDVTCNDCGETRVLFTYGDVNDDGRINNKDLGLLMQSLNQWEVSINMDAADVTGDGKVNNKDYGILMQYLNLWDVTLGPKA